MSPERDTAEKYFWDLPICRSIIEAAEITTIFYSSRDSNAVVLVFSLLLLLWDCIFNYEPLNTCSCYFSWQTVSFTVRLDIPFYVATLMCRYAYLFYCFSTATVPLIVSLYSYLSLLLLPGGVE